mmetsp:Transcript_29108/g.96675  ORF Transcript_29108/g.96675 Transcript_29108/m.96675 type:complete len:205 (+) Transcript_29108:354-968(+)
MRAPLFKEAQRGPTHSQSWRTGSEPSPCGSSSTAWCCVARSRSKRTSAGAHGAQRQEVRLKLKTGSNGTSSGHSTGRVRRRPGVAYATPNGGAQTSWVSMIRRMTRTRTRMIMPLPHRCPLRPWMMWPDCTASRWHPRAPRRHGCCGAPHGAWCYRRLKIGRKLALSCRCCRQRQSRTTRVSKRLDLGSGASRVTRTTSRNKQW